jgi:hypothetical protein
MIEQFCKLMTLLSSLKDDGYLSGYALAGGLAVSAWSPPRATEDVDLLILVEGQRGAEVLTKALNDAGLTAELRKGGFDDPIPCLIAACLNGLPVDLIVAARRWEEEAVNNARTVTLLGHDVPVITPEYLVAMKLKAGGPQDLLDARNILDAGEVNREMLLELARRMGIKRVLEQICGRE